MPKRPKTGSVGAIVKPVAKNQRVQSNRRGQLKQAAKSRKIGRGR